MKLFLRDAAMFYGLGILSFLILGGMPDIDHHQHYTQCGVANYRCN